MISLSHLNKLTYFISLIYILLFSSNLCIAAEDIWKKKDKKNTQSIEVDKEKKITIESPILSDDISKIIIKIDENEIEDSKKSVVGIFDPEENNFNLNMWLDTDGKNIKKVLKRINKLKYPNSPKIYFFRFYLQMHILQK